MIVFSGFPNDKIMTRDIKIDFKIFIFKNYETIYEEQLNTQMEDEEIQKIISCIKTIINAEKDETEFILTNFIEFLIWFDKRIDYVSPLISETIKQCINLTETPNLISLIINSPEDIKNYKLDYLINDFMELEFHLYNDNTFILFLKQICELYNRDYKTNMIYILERYLNKKAIEKIKNEFNMIDEGDIINIINGFLTKENIQIELDHMNFLMELVELNEEKND